MVEFAITDGQVKCRIVALLSLLKVSHVLLVMLQDSWNAVDVVLCRLMYSCYQC